MHVSQQLHEEYRRLDSSLSVLTAAARLLPADTPDAEFYTSEIPLAIEDAEQSMKRIAQLIATLEARIANGNGGHAPRD
jgi:hypothetical protein